METRMIDSNTYLVIKPERETMEEHQDEDTCNNVLERINELRPKRSHVHTTTACETKRRKTGKEPKATLKVTVGILLEKNSLKKGTSKKLDLPREMTYSEALIALRQQFRIPNSQPCRLVYFDATGIDQNMTIEELACRAQKIHTAPRMYLLKLATIGQIKTEIAATPSVMLRTMTYNYLGRSGLKVSNICLGTMLFGEDKGGRPYATEEESHAILDRFVELGGNFIDSADVYCGGKSEEIIGGWLVKQDRSKFVLATKCTRNVDPSNPNGNGASRGHIMTAVDNCLRRLQTNYVDILYVHLYDYGTPVEETLSALNDLVHCGKARYIGLSNMKGWQLQKYVELSKRYNYEHIVALQQQYSLLERSSEWEVAEVCRNEGIALLPWSPLKGGWLSGKMKRDGDGPASGTRVAWSSQPQNTAHHSHPDWKWFSSNEQAWGVIDKCEEISKDIGKTVPQVALRWLLQRPGVPSVVIGARTLEQLEGCMGASAGWELSKEQVDSLNEVSSIPSPYPYDYIPHNNKGRIPPGYVI